MMNLLLIGAPGAGKGTQARAISSMLEVPAVSTGDIFRFHIGRGTELGLSARRYTDAGDYVPDDITNRMVRERLSKPDATKGFLLDGYPRTVQQSAELDSMLHATSRALHGAIYLRVNRDELRRRLLRRAELEERPDDTAAVIEHRQELYERQTAPLLQVYRERGVLYEVDGTACAEEVTTQIVESLSLDHAVTR